MQQIGLMLNGYWWMDFLQTDLEAFSSSPPSDDPGGHPYHVAKLLKVMCKDIQMYLHIYHVIPVSSHCCCKEYFPKLQQ